MYRSFQKRSRNPRLPLIGTAKLRIAQISGSAAFDGAELFSSEHWSEVQDYSPNVLIGSTADLQRFVQRLDLHTLELTTIDYAIFVMTELGDQPITDVTRVLLWQRFGVPVYELYLDGANTLLGSECEAQEGWHIQPNTWFVAQAGQLMLQTSSGLALPTGLAYSIERQSCKCGRPGPRIVSYQTDSADTIDTEPLFAAIA